MRDPISLSGLDQQVEDISLLSRRGFIGSLVAGSMATSLLPGKSFAKQTPVHPLKPAAPDNDSYWNHIASQFLIRPGVSYMNSGTRGPSPRSVYEAQIQSIEQANADRLSYASHVYNLEFKASVREKLARFVGCKSNEIALTNNTTEGMVVGTFGPDLNPGDEIIYTNHDHSSGGQPINLRSARQGTIPVVVDLSAPKFHPPKSPDVIIDAFEQAITPRTRLISLCHINYTDGCVLPVKEICELARSKGILTLIDGAHPPGMMDLDIADIGCDMYAGAGHKWLLAGQLTGFFYVREDVQARIWPSFYSGPVNGRNLYGKPYSDAYIERSLTAEKYEMHGSTNYSLGVTINAALDFHNNIGQAAIEARDRYLAERVRKGIEEIPGTTIYSSDDPRLCAGLVSFRLKKVETKQVQKVLWERHGIYIRNVTHKEIDWDANRASMHIMVNTRQADDLVAAVEEIAHEAKS
ncbi:MAG: aminotransferase class V-fold PLP-dependent enzyme [Pseudomonadales bacterium]|jgi:isopenicillin-N epimerase